MLMTRKTLKGHLCKDFDFSTASMFGLKPTGELVHNVLLPVSKKGSKVYNLDAKMRFCCETF